MPSRIRYGKCRDFDCNKGYGFITPNDNSGDIFVHYKDINSDESFKSLYPGQNVSYQVDYSTGKRKSINVTVLSNNDPNINNNQSQSQNNHNLNQQNNYHQSSHLQNTNNNYINNQSQSSNNHPMNNNNLNNVQPSSSMNNYSYNNNMNPNPNHNHSHNHSSFQPQSQNTSTASANHSNNNQYGHYQSGPPLSPQSHQNYNNNNNNNNRSNLHSLNNNPHSRNENSFNQQKNIKHKEMDDCKVETRFKWQWRDDYGNWSDFTTKDSNNMLSAMKGQPVYYNIGQFQYEFTIDPRDPSRGQQRNTSTNRIRNCRKISTVFSVHKGLTLKKMLDSSCNNKYPSWWFDENADLHKAETVDWPLDNEICVEIIDRFNQSGHGYDIKSIYSVQNKFLWKQYQFQRELNSEALGKNKLNEKYLFHGTDYDAAQNITVQGFLRDHGRVMAFGRGTYFAKAASTSIGYSPQDTNGYQWMFLCAVILGESCAGSRAYQVPPTKPNSNVHYESMVDSTTNPQIFVISKDYQAYPLFLIKFTTDTAATLPFGFSSLMLGAHASNNQKKKKKKKGNKSNQRSKSLIPIKSQQMNANSNSDNNCNPNQAPKKRIVARSATTTNIPYTYTPPINNQSNNNNNNNASMTATATITTASNPFSFVNALPPPTVNNSLIVPTNLPILRPIILPIQPIPPAPGYPVSLIPGAPTVNNSSLVPLSSLASPHQTMPPQTTLSTQNSSSSLISTSIVSGLKSVPTQRALSSVPTQPSNNYQPPNPMSAAVLNTMLPSISNLSLNNNNGNVLNNNINTVNNNINNINNNNTSSNKLGGFKLSTNNPSTQIVSSNSSPIDPFRQQSPVLSATTPQSSQFNPNIGGPISSSSMITTNSNSINNVNCGHPQLQAPHTPPTMSPTLQSLPMLSSAPMANFTLASNGDMYNS